MEVEINIEEIQEFLPHRYPMLLVDRVTNMVLGESIKAYKNYRVIDTEINNS